MQLILPEKTIQLYGNPSARILFLQPVDDHDASLMQSEADEVAALTGRTDFCLAAVPLEDWNRDLPPWKAAPVFRGQNFGDGARETLEYILNTVIPALENEYPAETRACYLAGYSLAGLFSLWAGYETGFFKGIVAASPSVWYPDWIEYASSNPFKANRAYLSLGLKEEKARNPVMARVGNAIRKQAELFGEAGIPCQLDWNPGNHFVDSDKRTARGIAWMLQK